MDVKDPRVKIEDTGLSQDCIDDIQKPAQWHIHWVRIV